MRNFLIPLLLLVAPALGHAQITEADKALFPSRQLLKNGGFESGKTNWTASGGTFATTTTTPAAGAAHATWDSSSASQTLTSTAVAIPAGAYNKAGVASCSIKCASGTCTHKIQAYDGTNVLSEAVITSSTSTYTRTSTNFVLPASGNVSLRLISVASDEPSVSVDECFLGMAEGFNLSKVSQATFFGSATTTGVTNCAWTTPSAASTWQNFSADTDCNAPTVAGNASAPSTKIPGITFSYLPPGDYYVVATGYMGPNASTTGADVQYRFSDGTNTFGWSISEAAATAGQFFTSTIAGRVSRTTGASNVTIQMQAQTSTTSNLPLLYNAASKYQFEILVYRFPTTAETVFDADTSGWRVNAKIDGSNFDLAGTDQASFVELTNGSMTLTNGTGPDVIQAQIACASGTASSGTTCSAANESAGIAFNLPRAGAVMACASFSHYANPSTAGAYVEANFRIDETSNSSSTTTNAGENAYTTLKYAASAVATDNSSAMRVCSPFYFSSAGQKTLRLKYTQDVNGTVGINRIFTGSGRYLSWEIYPTSQGFPSPLVLPKKVYVRYYASAGFTTGTSSGRYAWDTKDFDTCSPACVTPGGTSPNTTWTFTAPKAGYYRVNMAASKTASAGSNGAPYLRTSGTGATSAHWIGDTAGNNEQQTGSSLIYLPLGGTFYMDNGTGSANNYANDPANNWVTVESTE